MCRSPLRKFMSIPTIHSIRHEHNVTSIMCKNLPESPFAFLSGGSKVICRIIVWNKGEPGDEAIRVVRSGVQRSKGHV